MDVTEKVKGAEASPNLVRNLCKMGATGSKTQTVLYTEAHVDIKQRFLTRLMTCLTQHYNTAVTEGTDTFRFTLTDICYLEEEGIQIIEIPLHIFQNAISQSIPVQYNLTITKNRSGYTTYEVRFLYAFSGKTSAVAAPSVRLAHAALAVAIANDDVCPITLEPLGHDKTNSVASCGHIVSSVYTETKCPLCRQDVGWTVLTAPPPHAGRAPE